MVALAARTPRQGQSRPPVLNDSASSGNLARLSRLLPLPDPGAVLATNGAVITIADPSSCPWPESLREQRCQECQAKQGRFAVNYLKFGTREEYDARGCLAQQQQAAAARRHARLLAESGLEAAEYTHTFATAERDRDNAALLDELQAWAPEQRGLLLMPPEERTADNPCGNGTGKSFLLHCLANRLCAEGIGCRFDLVETFLSEIRASFAPSDEERQLREAEIVQRYSTVPVLLWDDLGKEAFRTETLPSKLFKVIDARVRAMRPTFITTNFNLVALEERLGSENFGPAIVSRLAGACGIRRVGGPDRRWQGRR